MGAPAFRRLGNDAASGCAIGQSTRRALILTTVALTVSLSASAPAQGQNFWLDHRFINIAHQGAENEAPSNTMYSYERSLRLGADMLEVDIHTTADGQIVALHDAKVDRTTDGSGFVYEMTLAEVRKLDAAHDFVPGLGTENDAPEDDYAFRGIRSGELAPPPGYRRRDFRIPTLGEIMRRWPQVPINIEIKGRADTDFASFNRNADALAAFLNSLGRSEGIIVASFNDLALDRFHAQAPQIDLAPSIADVAAFKLANVPLPEGMVAFQVPITFQGVTVTDEDFVRRAHAQGYAVHVWLSNDGENEAIYDKLLALEIEGIMAAEAGRLEGVLCDRAVPRPERGRDWPGREHCSPSSIACEAHPAGAVRAGAHKLRLRLERRDQFLGRCAGKARIARAGKTLARGRFEFGKLPPREGGPKNLSVRIDLTRAGRRALSGAPLQARATAQPYDAFPSRTRIRVRADE